MGEKRGGKQHHGGELEQNPAFGRRPRLRNREHRHHEQAGAEQIRNGCHPRDRLDIRGLEREQRGSEHRDSPVAEQRLRQTEDESDADQMHGEARDMITAALYAARFVHARVPQIDHRSVRAARRQDENPPPAGGKRRGEQVEIVSGEIGVRDTAGQVRSGRRDEKRAEDEAGDAIGSTGHEESVAPGNRRRRVYYPSGSRRSRYRPVASYQRTRRTSANIDAASQTRRTELDGRYVQATGISAMRYPNL